MVILPSNAEVDPQGDAELISLRVTVEVGGSASNVEV